MISAILIARRRDLQIGLGIVLLYVGTRLVLLWRFPPHVDESLFASWTLRGFENADARFVALTSGQQPLLEWIGMGLMRLGVEPLTAVRLVSFFAGFGTLGFVWYLGRRLGGGSVGLAAAGLFAILPFFLVYSVVGLYDPLATFFVAAALVLQLHLAERPRLGTALLLGIALGAGLLTKLTTEIAYALIPLGALFFDWRGPRLTRRLATWGGGLAVALVVSWAMYQVLKLSEFYDDLGKARDVLLARHSVGAFLDHPWHWISANGSSYASAFSGYLTLPVIAVLAVGVVVVAKGRSRVGYFLVGWAVVPAAAAVALAEVPYVRWLDVGMPPIAILGAYGGLAVFAALRRRIHAPARRAVVLAVLSVLLVLPAAAWDAQTIAQPTTRSYPGHDDLDYVREYSAGGPWLDLVPELRRLAGGKPLQVAYAGQGVDYVRLGLRSDTNVSLVDSSVDPAPGALYGFENGKPLPSTGDALGWRQVRVYARSRHGVPVTLYVRGAIVDSRFAATPTELRALIGGTDSDYDRFGRLHPAVKEWAQAWYSAHPS